MAPGLPFKVYEEKKLVATCLTAYAAACIVEQAPYCTIKADGRNVYSKADGYKTFDDRYAFADFLNDKRKANRSK
jgi:hypothetical protein